jgi:hypothetical protein
MDESMRRNGWRKEVRSGSKTWFVGPAGLEPPTPCLEVMPVIAEEDTLRRIGGFILSTLRRIQTALTRTEE